MRPEEHEEYLNGVTMLASCVSVQCGPSEVQVDCFSPKSFLPLFCKRYRLPQSKLTLRESSRSFREMLQIWFGDEPQELADSLYYLFHRRLGDEQQVYELENPAAVISTLSDRHDPFYTMEDLFFVVFDDTAVCFLCGNYE